jgi:hypothetical protein
MINEDRKIRKHFSLHHKGIFCNMQITLQNGYTISMNLGGGGYNDNHDRISITDITKTPSNVNTDTVEVVVLDPDGAWVTNEFFPGAGADVIAGYVSVSDFEEGLKRVMKAGNTLKPNMPESQPKPERKKSRFEQIEMVE